MKNQAPAAVLADFLKRSREKVGLTQKQVAEHLGYSTAQFVSAWERAEREPPMNVIWKLAHLYRLSAESIFATMLEYRKQTLARELRSEFIASKPERQSLERARRRPRAAKNNR